MPRDIPPTSLRAAVRRQRPLLLTLLAVTGILALAISGSVPLAGQLLGVLLLGLVMVRLLVPGERLGALAVRHAGWDAAFMALVGVGLIILAGTPNL